MPSPSSICAFRARYVFPVERPPIADGVVAIEGRRISHVGPFDGRTGLVDLGNVAIVPGLVNAHTHLEFSHLEAPLGHAGMSFPDWIATVVAHRRQRDASGEDRRDEAIQLGLSESLRHGVAALGEIACGTWSDERYMAWPSEAVVFQELLGASPERIDPLIQTAREHAARRPRDATWRPGLSPHAPYTIHFELLAKTMRISRDTGVPVAMHLAESLDELRLLASHDGPLVPLLKDLNAWYPDAIPRGSRPMDYLRVLAEASRVLIVHGNHLADDEIRFLGRQADRMSVVFCPRTHKYFQHSRYPLRQMLRAGVNVALGTDSRASNPDLNLLAEMQAVAREFPELDPSEILRMGTLCGARALGLESRMGTLTPGKNAQLTFVSLPDLESEPHELLFTTEAKVTGTIGNGARF